MLTTSNPTPSKHLTSDRHQTCIYYKFSTCILNNIYCIPSLISSTDRYIHKLTDRRAYLPTPSSQVLQCPGGPLQRVRVWALRQEGEVRLYYRRMPQHLNAFGGLSSIWQWSHTIPLQKQWCDMKNKSVRQENTQNPSPSAS